MSGKTLHEVPHRVPTLYRRRVESRIGGEVEIESFDHQLRSRCIAITNCGIETIDPEMLVTKFIEGDEVSKFAFEGVLGQGHALNRYRPCRCPEPSRTYANFIRTV